MNKIVILPFLICGAALVGSTIARVIGKKKLETIFRKLYVAGFLLFYIGFLAVAGYVSIRDKNYSTLIFMAPFWLVGIILLKNRLFGTNDKGEEKEGPPKAVFAVVISAVLVLIVLLAGIYMLVVGIRDTNNAMVFGGAFFTLGSTVFVLAGLTVCGVFDKAKIDVLGLYAGIVIALIGAGTIALKYTESYSVTKMVEEFGLWILIPILMTVVGVIQIVKCIRNRQRIE